MKKLKKLFYENGHINRQLLITSFSIIITVALVLSTTIAAFTWSANSSDNAEIISGAIGVSINSTSGTLTLEDSYPMSNEDGIAQTNKYSFTVSNTTNNDVYYTIKLVNDEEAVTTDGCSGNQIDNQYINWNLSTNSVSKVLSEDNVIIVKQLLKGGESKNFDLRIWINESAPNNTSSKHFHGKLNLEYEQAYSNEIPTLAQVIKENNPVTKTTADIDFNTVADTDEGLIEGDDADGKTYYFRGAPQDNYLKIEGLDLMFRIVRINGDGTIRISLTESIGNTAFNTSNDNEKYVGYTYDNSAPNVQDGTDSTIKTFIDNWYQNTIKDAGYDSLFASTRYCNDTSVASTSGSNINYGAYNRLVTNKTPSFMCPSTEKTYGGEYTLKVGMLSADEYIFAGGKNLTPNSLNYLNIASVKNCIWVGSPYQFYFVSNEFGVYNNGQIYSDFSVSQPFDVVPVLNLKFDTMYVSGDGTEGNPYIVEKPKTLAQVIKENNPVEKTTADIDFNTVATTDEGLIEGDDADGKTYYFRGAPQDNYLKIEGLDLMFRIVRINGDGTIRISLTESIGNSAFNTNYDNEKYVGYTYDNSKICMSDNLCNGTEGTNSTIKTFIDNWYQSTIEDTGYDSLFASTRYCNDTTISLTNRSNYYGAYNRLQNNNNPTFICPITEKTYGGEYNLKVGLLSADEYIFTGGKYNIINTQHYMYTGSDMHLLTPNYFVGFASMFHVYSSALLEFNDVDVAAGVVPILNLKANTVYENGIGTESDPYIISN